MFFPLTDKHKSRKVCCDFDSILANSSAYDLLQSAVAIVDARGAIVYANQAFSDFNQAARKSIEECCKKGSLLGNVEVKSWLVDALRDGVPTSLESIFYYGPKMPVELSICLMPLNGQDNQLRGGLLTLGEESIEFNRRYLARLQQKNRTFSERILTLERENINSQKLISELLREAPVAMVLINKRWEIVYANRAATSLLKIDNADIRGQRCENVLLCKNISSINSTLDLDVISSVEEISVRNFEGDELTLLRTLSRVGANDSQVMIIAAFLDVTEIKLAEVEYHSILQTALDGFWLVDTNGSLREVNDAYCRMSGYSREELLTMSIQDLEENEDVNETSRHIEKIVSEGSDRFESVHRHKNGKVFNVDISVQYLPMRKGVFVVFIKDITEQKRYEMVMKGAREEAENANKAKSTFLSNMSHELRTPLNAIIGFSQILKTENLPDESREEVDYIYKSGKHLLTLINEVLDLSKIEAGKVDLTPVALDISDLFSECFNIVAPLASDAGILLDIQAEQTGLRIMADRDRIVQVMLNLASNAIKYNQPKGLVSISAARTQKNHIRISVSDTGIGISEQDLEKLFKPFSRLGSKVVEGTGIGLTISKQLTELMGGQIGVESKEGKGSIFWIQFPMHNSENEIRKLKLPLEPGEIVSQTEKDEVILYIEDNSVNLRLIERVLARAGFTNVVTAVDGLSGLQMAVSQSPSLILLDIGLPDISGWEVFQKIRSNPATSEIPVIAVSANAMPEDIARGKADGFDDYLTKPLNLPEFIAAVSRLLPERQNVMKK